MDKEVLKEIHVLTFRNENYIFLYNCDAILHYRAMLYRMRIVFDGRRSFYTYKSFCQLFSQR